MGDIERITVEKKRGLVHKSMRLSEVRLWRTGA